MCVCVCVRVNRLCTEIKTQQCAIIIIVKRGAYRTRQIATLESWTRPKAKRLKVATPTVTATSATLADAQQQHQEQQERKLAATTCRADQGSVYNDLWANGPTRTLTLALAHSHTHTLAPTPHKTKMAHIRDPRRTKVCYAWPFQAMLANQKRPKSKRATSQLAKTASK